MFTGNFGTSNLRRRPDIKPSEAPPATPIVSLPILEFPSPSPEAKRSLVRHLQSYFRPGDINAALFANIGLEIKQDVPVEEIIPDPSYLPPPEWETISLEESRNEAPSNIKLANGQPLPGVRKYVEFREQMSINNADAFKTIRRLEGTRRVSLGNCYNFYRHLENFTYFWDDTSVPLKTAEELEEEEKQRQAIHAAKDAEEKVKDASLKGPQGTDHKFACCDLDYFRTEKGANMPQEHRTSLTNALVKLVAWEFGGNMNPSRSEPRLHLCAPPTLGSNGQPRRSYIASSATWIFRSPSDRNLARSGVIEGPIAAVSSRATIEFDNELVVHQDLVRELVAVLVTAQYRNREGKKEFRLGQGAWWTSKPRWGGGPGGPLGREQDTPAAAAERKAAAERAKKDRLEAPVEVAPPPSSSGGPGSRFSSESLSARFARPGSLAAMSMKRAKTKTTTVEEQYRQMLPPSPMWDEKTRYMAIGRQKGADYDDIFVVECLYHHISLLRARVPIGLMNILDGQIENVDYDKLVLLRSTWYDLFKIEERRQLLRLLWGMMWYQVRDTLTKVKKSETA